MLFRSPLFRAGYFPPSVLAFWGVPNPWSGALLWALIGLCALWVGLSLLSTNEPESTGKRAVSAGVGAGAVLIPLALLLAATPQAAPADLQAQAFMRSVWLAPPGKQVPFWPRR